MQTIKSLWGKVRLPLFIATLCLGCIGWTTAYWLWQPIRTEANQVWQDYQIRQLNNGIGDSVKAQEEQKTESFVPTDGTGVHYAALRESGVQEASAPTPSAIEKKIYETWQNQEQAKIAVAVAKSESHLDCKAIGDKHLAFFSKGIEYGRSYGVFQIRHLEGRPNPEELLDPEFNVNYAYQLFLKSGFQPWSQYKNGAYTKYL